MKNADMPAMPQAATESGHGCNYNGYNGAGVPTGLTKREMMAMHICSGNMAARNVPWCDVNVELQAQIAVQMTDALLAELEKQQ